MMTYYRMCTKFCISEFESQWINYRVLTRNLPVLKNVNKMADRFGAESDFQVDRSVAKSTKKAANVETKVFN